MRKKGNFLGQPWEIRVAPVNSLAHNQALHSSQELLDSIKATRYFQVTATIYDWTFAVINAVPAADVTAQVEALEGAVKQYIYERDELQAPVEAALTNLGFNFV